MRSILPVFTLRLEEQQSMAEEIRRKQDELEREQMVIAERFENQDQELAHKTRKLDLLRSKYQELKQEIEDVTAENTRDREELLETVRELTKELRKKEMIITNFIPDGIAEGLESRTTFNEEEEEWELKPAR